MAHERMNKPNRDRSEWHFPADILAIFAMTVVPIILALAGGFLFTPLFRARRGDPTMLYIAVVLAAVGIVLLFIARFPLYRQRRFFSLGPGALDPKHRRIYWWAYVFIGCSGVMLVLL